MKQAWKIRTFAINPVMVPNPIFVAQKNAAVASVFGRLEKFINAQGQPVNETREGDDQHGVVAASLDEDRRFSFTQFVDFFQTLTRLSEANSMFVITGLRSCRAFSKHVLNRSAKTMMPGSAIMVE